VLPYLMPDETGLRAWDCETCQDPNSPHFREIETRCAMHCGWMTEDCWTDPGQLPEYIGKYRYEERVCPGALVRYSQIVEASAACAAYRANQLDVVFPNPANALVEAVLEMDSALKVHEAEQMAKLKDKT
jgi:hypothetical protein